MPNDANPAVRRGHLRVDFTKGAHKLSRHLLVDPSTYLLEIVRVAILSGATRVGIEYDANDVVVEFDGTSFEYGQVEDLFTRVVSESFDKRLYLLAIAIGAALTVSDGTVTVFGHERDGSAHSTTYDNEAPGRATPGGKLPMKRRDFRGTLIHVRRSFGLAVAKAAFTRAEPREVKLVRERAARAPIAIFIRGERARALDPLLRVELGTTLGLDVAIELVPVRKSPPTLLFAELGIPVVESTWVPEPWMLAHLGAVPIVVRADGPSLLLNASRSQVQEDIVRETREFAAQGLRKLADAIRERLDRGAVDVETEDAIGTIAGGIRAAYESRFSFLLDRPLLRDGLGRGVSLREVDNGERFGFFIRGDRPLTPEHEHVARDVLWLRGRAIEAFVLERRLPFETVKGEANSGVKRRMRLLSMPSEMPAVDAAGADIAIRKIESSDGIRGELILRDPASRDPRAWATLRVYLEGHPIKTITLGEHDGWLPYDAAISWEGHFEPTLAYDDLRSNAATRSLTRILVEEAGRALLDAFGSAGADASDGLRALALRTLDRVPDPPALRALPAFGTADGRFVGLDAVVAIARRDGAILGAQDPPPSPSAQEGREVFVLGGIASSIVARAIAPARILQYDAFLRPVAFSIESAFASVCERIGENPHLVLRDAHPRGRAMVGLASQTVIARFHAGYQVEWTTQRSGVGMVMVTDEPSAFPDVETHTAAPRIDDWVAEMRSRLVVAAVESSADLVSLAPFIHELVASGAVAESTYPVLFAAPLFRMLDRAGMPVLTSAAQIVETHAGQRPIPFLPAAPTFPITDWRVVIAPDTFAIDALTKLTRRAFFKATLELHHREREARASALRDDVMRKRPFTGPPPELHPLSPVVELRGDGFLLRAGLRRNANDERTRATILYDGRELSRADFDSSVGSLTVVADFPASDAFAEVSTLAEPRRSALERALEAVIPHLGRALVATGKPGVLEDIALVRFLAKAAPLATGLFDGASVDVPTVQGGRAALRDLLSHVRSKRFRFGRASKVPWPVSPVSTSLDEPILFAPIGELGDALLAALRGAGFIVDDMTRVIAEEVAKRRGEPPPPREDLPGVVLVPPRADAPLPPTPPVPVMPAVSAQQAPMPPLAQPTPRESAPVAPTDPVGAALLALLRTTGRFAAPPYPGLRYTGGRRPVRYRPDERGGVVELGGGAKSIATLLGRSDVITLATSALSEINRELVAVTDQEEVNALLFLLKSL